jgi:hypothetical protein
MSWGIRRGDGSNVEDRTLKAKMLIVRNVVSRMTKVEIRHLTFQSFNILA